MFRASVIVWILATTLVSRAAAPLGDAWCGTDGGELPDLWQQTVLELEALEEISKAEAWSYAPGRVNVFLGKFALLHRGSVRQGADTMKAVRQTMDSLGKMRSTLVNAAMTTNLLAYTQSVATVRTMMEELYPKYQPGSLKLGIAKINPKAFLPASPTLTVKAISPPLVSNQTVQVDLRLRDAKGAGVGSLQLMEMHTRRLHVLAVDPALEDYHHEHPITSGRPGDFVFVMTPRRTGNYLMWLDVTPLATGRNEAPQAVIGTGPVLTRPVSKVTQMQSSTDGWSFVLRLDRKKVVVGQPVNARLRVTDPQGQPCFALEPLMGSFAHIVGFLDDRNTMIHVHSHGEPPHELARSGPEVPFRFIVPKSGFLKLFVQTQVNGNVILAKFGFPVEQGASSVTPLSNSVPAVVAGSADDAR
jgi:hypothetical protein